MRYTIFYKHFMHAMAFTLSVFKNTGLRLSVKPPSFKSIEARA